MTSRRNFLKTSVIAGVLPGFLNIHEEDLEQSKTSECNYKASEDISVGVIAHANNPEDDLKVVRDMGFSVCQLHIKEYSPELARRLVGTLDQYRIRPCSLICMGPGKYAWNFTDGPSTIGLIPRETREARITRLKQGIDFCKAAGIPAVHAHFGFIPKNPQDILYSEFIAIMKNLGEYGLKQGIDLYFETGQETPITLLRTIEDVGTGNLFVNCDLANLVMYGKSNPLDGLRVLSKYVKALHAKDGTYPTDPYRLGKEMPIPEGTVDFPKVIEFLKRINFKGDVIIECELSAVKTDYIIHTKKYLERLILS